MQQMLFSIALGFGFPTAWVLPHLFNRWFFKMPLIWLFVVKSMQVVAVV